MTALLMLELYRIFFIFFHFLFQMGSILRMTGHSLEENLKRSFLFWINFLPLVRVILLGSVMMG